MTKSGLLGAAALLIGTAIAAPAMAQTVIDNPGYCTQFYPDGSCATTAPANPAQGRYHRRIAYRTTGGEWNHSADWNNGWNTSWNDNRWDRHDTGFWPGDVAADVVGGAVGTAGAIATAPFRDNSYAYDNNGYGDNGTYANNGWNGWYNQSYAQRNGFVCQPGTLFKGEDGRRHICQ